MVYFGEPRWGGKRELDGSNSASRTEEAREGERHEVGKICEEELTEFEL